MRSIKEIFVIGHGPSSSHTMGPAFACDYILKKYPDAKFIKVTLLGSLALTGKGHLTDYIVDLKLKKVPHIINFDLTRKPRHPNTLIFNIENGDGITHHVRKLWRASGTAWPPRRRRRSASP